MKKKALIVGINYTGTGNALKGCLNDAKNMQALLESRGFTEIKPVLEKEATTAGIKAGLEWLVADTQPGDVIVFHYSGHGSQLPSSVEEDKWEEIICPVDLNWTDKVITDNTLREIFDKVPNGVNTTLVLDCCHSGTMLDQNQTMGGTKEIAPALKKEKGSRYLKPPAKIAKQVAKGKLVDWETSKDVNATALLIAGCHASQTSADAVIDGVPQGAATSSLLKAVAADSAISYRSLVTNMQGYMVQKGFKQIPQLDGAESLYDQIFLEPFSFAVPAEPVAPVIDTPAGPVVESLESSDKTKPLLIIGAIIALIVLFLVFG
jgi:metacaspase-1